MQYNLKSQSLIYSVQEIVGSLTVVNQAYVNLKIKIEILRKIVYSYIIDVLIYTLFT